MPPDWCAEDLENNLCGLDVFENIPPQHTYYNKHYPRGLNDYRDDDKSRDLKELSSSESLIPTRHRTVVPNVVCDACRRALGEARLFDVLQRKQLGGQDQILPYEELPMQEIMHYNQFQDFEESALNECHLCIILLNSIRSRALPDTIMKFRCALDCATTYDMLDAFDKDARALSVEHRTDSGLLHENAELREAQLSTSTESTLPIIENWMKECCSHHKDCVVTRGNFNPTRLLDVLSLGSRRLSLHIPESGDAPLEYLALSHCWGALKILTLTSNAMRKMTEEINLKDLPKTFRHAIQICRRLGFRYLWIDALCILQDSKQDWEMESSRMGSVYEYSSASIGALWGQNSHSGCFHFRQPLEQYPCYIQNSSSGPVYISDSSHIELVQNNNKMQGWSLKPGYRTVPPLNTRAWVTQERVLAPRTIFFGSDLISWECREGAASEIQPEFRWKNDNLKSCYQDFCGSLDMDSLRVWHDFGTFYRSWIIFLRVYTAGRLTKEQDRLVALRGIVERIQKSTKLTNIFGLWKEFLHVELLWHRELKSESARMIPPPKVARAPSWSWASQDGPVTVEYFARDRVYISEIACQTITRQNRTTPNYPCLSLLGRLMLFSGRIHASSSLESDGYYKLSSIQHDNMLRFIPDDPGVWKNKTSVECYLLLGVKYEDICIYELGLVLSKQRSGHFLRVGTFLNVRLLGGVAQVNLFSQDLTGNTRVNIVIE